MRLPFPERFPLQYVLLFDVILSSVQQIQGTDFRFTLYSFLFVLVAALTFNTTGGFTRPSGGYVFFYSLGVIAGLTGKAVLGEAADTNLSAPNLTMLVFLGGISAMWVAAFISRRLVAKRAFLQHIVKPKDMRNATLGCLVTGFAITLVNAVIPHSGGSVLSALNQVNQFIPMAIILGTVHQIRRTGGKSSISFLVVLSFSLMFFYNGLAEFSKQGLFTPLLCWFIAAASMRYRMRLYQMVILGAMSFLLVHYFVPYSQYGRDVEGAGIDLEGNIHVALSLLTDLDSVRDNYLVNQGETFELGRNAYFDQNEGFLDRIQIFRPDDDLINVTEERGTFGLSPVWLSFINLIPHVFYPNKKTIYFGNDYAHEVGSLVSDDDFSTGVSFSPSAEGYHMAKWTGVLIVAPILWTMLFALFDSLCGDVRKSPWGLLVIAVFSHTAPEGMLGGVIYMMGFTTIGLLFAAFAAAYVMPIIGTLLAGPEQASQKRTVQLLNPVQGARALNRPKTTE